MQSELLYFVLKVDILLWVYNLNSVQDNTALNTIVKVKCLTDEWSLFISNVEVFKFLGSKPLLQSKKTEIRQVRVIFVHSSKQKQTKTAKKYFDRS